MAVSSTSSLSTSHCFSSPLSYSSSIFGARQQNRAMLVIVRMPAPFRASAESKHERTGEGSNGESKRDRKREMEARERKEVVNRKIASQKAISAILRREATKAVIEKKGSINSRKLLPRTVLEALHERITALRWESALKIFDLLRGQLWYTPNPGIYIKLIVMLGKCKQPDRAHALFQAMSDEGCIINHETYTALVSAYSRSGLFDKAFFLLENMKNTDGCHPDVQTYSILIKSCLHYFKFDKVQFLLADMKNLGIEPNTVTFNTLIDAYGKAERFAEMESTLMEMLGNHDCKPDIWTMNATLRAFGGSGQIEMMEKCYDKFQGSGISPDIKTFNILLDSYGKARKYEKMSAVMEYMQKYYFSWTLVTYNVVIDAFGRAGDLKQMEYIFRLMKSERIKPNRVTLCSLIRAYGRAEAVDKIKAVLRYIENSDVMLDTVFFNCLVDAYGRAGCLSEMREVLELMQKRACRPDKITYSTMIKAYLSRGINDQRVHNLQDISQEEALSLSQRSCSL
ncbi:pentatricopeptide repeat-containing protein At5g48730, chloroplastic [Phalaenopsis equestris]|uniref:pentatricopeptide repeat-containing protein At5g48730, chloroplastic n=1 Tax=Phalaenopsis equestris TaxID=78828 RepID=UPI0009E4BBB5|nr:pentatricopeptide repeat-containing protein At5g48730, chloroplastic [Phalaenopsis equestris]